MKQHSAAQNRAILLTPPGVGAIAVVRILGPRTNEFLAQHFSKRAQAGRCVHGLLVDGARQIDDPVVVLHSDGRAADLNLHGGTWVVRAALELAARSGFQIVESSDSEISAEGIDSGDVIQREAFAHLPRALTELGVRSLLSQPAAWRKLNHELQGIDGAQKRQITQRILEDRSLWWLLNPPRVAIVGAANVGKSTLANQLFAQERSITADIPGTTRDWVGEIANIDGLPIMLLDTPGIRPTSDVIEQQAIRQSGEEIARADLVILVLDSSRPLEPDQMPLLEEYREAIVVVNKSDRRPVWSQEEHEAVKDAALSPPPVFRGRVGEVVRASGAPSPTQPPPQPSPGVPGEGETLSRAESRLMRGPICIVATTGEGIDVLRPRIGQHFGCEELDCDRARWWIERQRAFLESTLLEPE